MNDSMQSLEAKAAERYKEIKRLWDKKNPGANFDVCLFASWEFIQKERDSWRSLARWAVIAHIAWLVYVWFGGNK